MENITKDTEFGVHKWKIPKLGSQECKREWLRAFFDCEAYVYKKYLRVQSVNRIGIYQVKDLLAEFNIHSNINRYKPNRKNHSEVFMLTIGKKMDKRRYKESIGFNHKIKLKKLDKQLSKDAAIA